MEDLAKQNTTLVAYKPPSALSPRSLLMVVFRRKRLIGLSFVGLLAGLILAIAILPDQYQAEMKVLVQRERLDPIISATTASPSAAQVQLAKLSEQDVNSEVDLIQSEDLLRQVVVTCGLEDGLSWWRKMLPRPAQHIFWPDRDTRIGLAVQALQDNLTVVPPNQSNLIKLTYQSSDPNSAAKVLRTLGETYANKHLEVHRPTGTYKFFQEAVDRYRKELDEVQAQLVQFSKNENVVAADLEKTNTVQKLAEFDATLATTRAAVSETERRIDELQSLAKSTPARRTTQVKTSAVLIEGLKANLYNLNLRRTGLLNKYNPQNRLVTDVDKEIAEVKGAIASVERAPAVEQTTDGDPTYDWLSSELAKARSELAGLRARATQTENIVSAYRVRGQHLDRTGLAQQDLLRTAKLAEENYVSAVRKREEARMSDELDRGRIMNVAIAESPNVPAIPMTSLLLKLALCLLLSVMTSLGLGFAADYVDPSFRTPEELERFLAIPVLATIPAPADMKVINP